MNKFRLKLDMSEIYEDERKLAYVLVDRNWSDIRSLQDHVQKIFKIPKVRFLLGNVYIPSRESLDIITSNDTLKVVLPQKSLAKRRNKICHSSFDGAGDQSQITDNSIVGEKRKCVELILTSSTPRPAKKRRTSVDLDISDTQQMGNGSHPKGIVRSTGSSSTNAVTSTNTDLEKPHIDDLTVETNEETAKTRKRTRVRRKKKQEQSVVEDEKSARISSVPVPISSSTLRYSKSLGTPNETRKHVHFNDTPIPINHTPEPTKSHIVFRSRLTMDAEALPREIGPEEEVVPAEISKKSTIEIQENIVLIKANDVSPQQEQANDSSVIEIDEEEEDTMKVASDEDDQGQDFVDLSSTKCTENTMVELKSEKILPLAEPLVGLPSSGDIVLFKMYRLNESTPEVTDFICSRCEKVDKVNKTMSCLILDGLDQIDDPSEQCNGHVLPVRSNSMLLHLDQLIDKKIFKMS